MAFWGPLSLQTPDDYVTQTPGYEQQRQQTPVYQPPQPGEGVFAPTGLTPQDVDTATVAEQGPVTGGTDWMGLAGMVGGGQKNAKDPSEGGTDPLYTPGSQNVVTGQGIGSAAISGQGSALDAWRRLWPEWGGTPSR